MSHKIILWREIDISSYVFCSSSPPLPPPLPLSLSPSLPPFLTPSSDLCLHMYVHVHVNDRHTYIPCLQSMGSSGVYMYQPHIRTVTDFALPSSQACTNFHLLSTSSDGTLRSTDCEKGVLDLVS